MASIPTPRGKAAACTISHQAVYVFGGVADVSERVLLDTIECYKTVADRWETVKLIMNQGWKPRFAAAACPVDEDAMLVFGGAEKSDTDSVLAVEFTPNSSAVKKDSMLAAGALTGGQVCVKRLGKRIYAVSGHQCLLYNVETHLWRKIRMEAK